METSSGVFRKCYIGSLEVARGPLSDRHTMPGRKLRPSALAILTALVEGANYGFDVMAATGLPSGTVYPILSRLERDGLVRSKWEDVRIARREKRPPRRYYEATAVGAERLEGSLERLGRGRRSKSVEPSLETP